ncbi:MAG: MFS transporter [Candidatus Fermentithermobacillus carboniphilus]|uniref:MFS transporter n=1 Tax=Candidatus Fermentithermobacillus carboniphilus TaxID=3085328 RepID=A0AAT9LE91_9FIRM|nr:MAG: MFS transporter [Candidatus Fermentithermobacillus carboniphilus]
MSRLGIFKFQRNANLYLQVVSMASLAQGAYGVIQGLYVLALGLDETVLGTILSARMLSAAIASLPAGILSDRWGRKPVLLASGILTTVGFLGQAVFSTPSMMVFFSCLVGIAMACQATTGAPLLAESSTGQDRARLFGVNFSLSMGATMLGSLLGGYLPRQLSIFGEVKSFRISLVVFALVTFLGVFPAMNIQEKRCFNGERADLDFGQVAGKGRDKRFFSWVPGLSGMLERARDESLSLWDTVKQREVLNLLNYSVLIGFGAGMVIPFFNVFLSKKLGLDTGTVGLILSFSQGATALAGLLAPLMARKYGKVVTVVATQIASIPFLLLIALPPNVYLVSFALFMRSALMNMSNPVASNFSMEVIPAGKRGRVSSLMRIADNISRSFSAYVAGYIMARWSYETPYFFTAVFYLLASWVYWKAFKDWESRVNGQTSI